MISLELSSIQSKDADRAWLAQAMESYVSAGKPIELVPITRNAFTTPFNSEALIPGTDRPTDKAADADSKISLRNRSIKIQKSAKARAHEQEIALKLADFYESGVVAASKALQLSVRRVNHIAEAFGVKFATRQPAKAAEDEKLMLPKIRELAAAGRTQVEIAQEMRVGRITIRRLAAADGIKFRSFVEREKDRRLAERITSIRDIGCTRAQCARQLEINPKVLLRLIAEYQIDYPLAGNHRNCAA